jgi:site-specific recombinase XerD
MAAELLRTRLRAWLAAYFSSLRAERNLSLNTIRTYKDAWKLIFEFGARKRAMPTPGDWRLGQVDRRLVLDFLEYIETDRSCCVATRNSRLAAVQSFFTWLRGVEPTLRDHTERVLAIQRKRAHRPVVAHLEVDELRRVLDVVDLTRPDGMRDFALLCFAYNTGARVHEIAALRKEWLMLHRLPTVRLWGKGNKERELPLWDACARVLRLYLKAHRRPRRTPAEEPFVFIGQRGERMTRFGVARLIQQAFIRAERLCPSLQHKALTAHSMRHTTAVHLLQSGADLVTIQNWLGHESLESVRTYLSLDLQAKRNVLQCCLTTDYVATRLERGRIHLDPVKDAENWLDSL